MSGLTEIDEVGPSLAAALIKKKFLTIAQVAAAEPVKLSTVSGISDQKAARMISSARSLLVKSRAPGTARKRSRKPVAPPKVGTVSRARTEKDGIAAAKISQEKLSAEIKNAKNEKKIKKLKKKIRKLKKQKRKILTRDKKRSGKS